MLKLESIFLYNSAKKELILYKSLSEFYIKVFCNRSGKRYNFFHSQDLTKVLGNLGGFCKWKYTKSTTARKSVLDTASGI